MDELTLKKLENLRGQIDEIDDQLLELLAKRSEFVLEVGELKEKSGEKGAFIRPAREAKMMREILKRGAGDFPKHGLFAIWRVIIAASLGMEGGLQIVMPRSKNFHMHKLIVEYFGSLTPYALCDSVDAALGQVQGNVIGVFNVSDDWWRKDLGNKKVFAKLHDDLFALADVKTEEAGGDKTLIFSPTEIEELPHLAFQEGGYLYEVSGYITEESQLEYENVKILGNYA